MMNEMRRHSESMPQPHVPVTHDYNRGARKFTQTVGHEKGAIISPAIQRVFKDLVNDNKFKPQNGDKILDIGCGPFLLAMPFIRDGIHVDGVDTSSEMLSIAAETIENAKPKLNGVSSRLLRADKVKLVETMSEVRKNSYQMAMMNFVHQCAPTARSLNRLFKEAAEKIKPGGTLIITGAHPEYLHNKHACCEYDIKDSSKMKDGQQYSGRIFDDFGNATYELYGDYFWSIPKITEAGSKAGLRLSSVQPIDDIETSLRPASSPAYFAMSLRK